MQRLWELPAEEAMAALEAMVTGRPADDPHERLLFLQYLKDRPLTYPVVEHWGTDYASAIRLSKQLPAARFLALLAELRCFGRSTPLRHRDSAHFCDQMHSQQCLGALNLLQQRAQQGDEEAWHALFRIAVEAEQEDVRRLATERLGAYPPALAWLDGWRALYRTSPFWDRAQSVRDRCRQPVVLEVDLPPLPASREGAQTRRWTEAPVWQTPAARSLAPDRPAPGWDTHYLENTGDLSVILNERGESMTFRIDEEKVSFNRLVYRTYLPPKSGPFTGSGTCRRITSTRLSTDMEMLAVRCHDGTLDFLDVTCCRLAMLDQQEDWCCYSLTHDRNVAVGGPDGISLVALHSPLQREVVHREPTLDLISTPRGIWSLHQDRTVWHEGKRVLALAEGRARFSPNGLFLVYWTPDGEVCLIGLERCRTLAKFDSRWPGGNVVFSRDSACLCVTRGRDARLWSLAGEALRERRFPDPARPLAAREQESADELSREWLRSQDGFFDRLSSTD